MTFYFLGLCGMCRRVLFFVVFVCTFRLGWVARALAQSGGPPPVPTQDTGALWAQLLTAGVILAIGVWAIKEFLKFKEAAEKSMAEGTKESARRLQEVKDDLGIKVTELNHALMGVAGHGGILAMADADQRRRHDLANHIHRIAHVLSEVVRLQGLICQRLDIPYDAQLGQNLERKGDGTR